MNSEERIAKLRSSVKQAVSRIEALGSQLDALLDELDDPSHFDLEGGAQRRIARARQVIATGPGAIDFVHQAIELTREFVDPTKAKP